MAYTEVKTVATGDGWTANDMNVYIKANFEAGVPDLMTTKGDIVAATAADVAARLGVGSNGKILSANSGQSTGLEWITSPESDIVTTKGDMLFASAADTLGRLAIGTDGKVLTANSAQSLGVEWALKPESDIITAKGDLVVGTAADTIGVLTGAPDYGILVADSGESAGMRWVTSSGGRCHDAYQGSLTSTGWVLLDFATEDFDADGSTERGYSTGVFEYTAAATGYYLVIAMGVLNLRTGTLSKTAGASFILRADIEGTGLVDVIASKVFQVTNSYCPVVNGSTIMALSQGEVLRISGYASSGTANNWVDSNCFVNVIRLGVTG